MAAGPWFTVVRSDGGFTDVGEVWLSDGGGEDGPATLQMSVRIDALEETP